MAWNDEANAPYAGELICGLEDLNEGQGREFSFGGSGYPFSMFVVRNGNMIRGYVNACPHTGAPLNWSPDNFTSEDGKFIICSTHGALFEMKDGYCCFGPCVGDYLEIVPLEIRGDALLIGTE